MVLSFPYLCALILGGRVKPLRVLAVHNSLPPS